MATAKNKQKVPDFREFIKENDQQLYDFCFYMAQGSVSPEEVVLRVFRDFGERLRKTSAKQESTWESLEHRLALFRIAWERVRESVDTIQFSTGNGRDTRPLKALDEDLLESWGRKKIAWSELESPVMDRLTRIDLDFRAPVVLRDILRFEDEEAMRILGLRWGVYRHRLHRGRLEFTEGLKGRAKAAVLKPVSP